MNNFYDINFLDTKKLVNMTEEEKEQNGGVRFRPFFRRPDIEIEKGDNIYE